MVWRFRMKVLGRLAPRLARLVGQAWIVLVRPAWMEDYHDRTFYCAVPALEMVDVEPRFVI